jgi:ADP-dependent NAD(P)H-hydrate dehydratase / NAD(P)H-hydrate epimerase
MSLTIIGTVPNDDFPLVKGPCFFEGKDLIVSGYRIITSRGTPALLAAACVVSQALELDAPEAVLAGDTGKGGGSVKIYESIVKNGFLGSEDVLVFHYLQPDVYWHDKILWKLQELPKTPVLVADAGYMYVAKMSGSASCYDLFTPDAGELAFLADEQAPHPFYTRGFLLQDQASSPQLVDLAYKNDNAARYLLVKGETDIVASREGIISRIDEPCVENMEPIGGTGDTLTGIVAALIDSGRDVPESAILGAKINRIMGQICRPSPATSILELIKCLPDAIGKAVN